MQNESLERKTLHFRQGDWDFLESVFRPNGIATSVAIRTIISRWVDARRQPDAALNEDFEL